MVWVVVGQNGDLGEVGGTSSVVVAGVGVVSGFDAVVTGVADSSHRVLRGLLIMEIILKMDV